MKAIQIIQTAMINTSTSLSELAEYANLGTKENVYQMLKRKDLKVGSFAAMLEVMGYQLVVQNIENSDDEIIIDYEGD